MYYISNAEIEIRTSTKRIIGAVFFGLILSGYIDNAFRYTIPRIISIAQKIELDLALIKYESSILINLIIGTVIGFFVAALSAFFGQKERNYSWHTSKFHLYSLNRGWFNISHCGISR